MLTLHAYEVCLRNSGISARSENLRFAQENPRMARIRTLRITDTFLSGLFVHDENVLQSVTCVHFLAPSHSVSGLTLQPSNEGTEALRVSWESADLSLPEGPVSFYGVEYRDGQNGLSNTARVRPDSSYFIIYGVENGDAYEVSL